MVKHRKGYKKRRVVRGTRGYKKCIVAGMRRIKFTSPRAARKAFARVAKACKKKLCITPKRAGKRGKKRHCKYGHRKGSKRCRKHPVKRR